MTLGKYLLKIKVVSTDGQPLTFMSVLIRETVGRYLSTVILYIGYMLAGWNEEKQGLHDKIADTYVVYRDMSVKKERPKEQEQTRIEAMPVEQAEGHVFGNFEGDN